MAKKTTATKSKTSPVSTHKITQRNVRAEARGMFDHAAQGVIAAFNLAGSRDWHFPPDVQVRALELVRELSYFFFDNETKITPRDGAHAQEDVDFQRFLGKLTG
ncbi:MAG: hypothetical protein AABZ67_16600 [Pseudomonadota bacterium]